MSHYAKATITVALVFIGLAAAWAVRNILVLILVAGVLAVGLDPAVRRLQRMHLPRGWAVIIIFVILVGLLVLFGFLVVPPLAKEVRGLAADIPTTSGASSTTASSSPTFRRSTTSRRS
jgi:predicted PurR-regulated permease PerM